MRTDVLFAELASDFNGELVVGGGPFREPPTVMQSTVCSTPTPRLRTAISIAMKSLGSPSEYK